MSIPGVEDFEIGSGFGSAEMQGSKHKDHFVAATVNPAEAEKLGTPCSKINTKTNHSGGV